MAVKNLPVWQLRRFLIDRKKSLCACVCVRAGCVCYLFGSSLIMWSGRLFLVWLFALGAPCSVLQSVVCGYCFPPREFNLCSMKKGNIPDIWIKSARTCWQIRDSFFFFFNAVTTSKWTDWLRDIIRLQPVLNSPHDKELPEDFDQSMDEA